MCYDYASTYEPPKPKILIAIEDETGAAILRNYVGEHAKVISPDVRDIGPDGPYGTLILIGDYQSKRGKTLYHVHVVPHLASNPTVLWL